MKRAWQLTGSKKKWEYRFEEAEAQQRRTYFSAIDSDSSLSLHWSLPLALRFSRSMRAQVRRHAHYLRPFSVQICPFRRRFFDLFPPRSASCGGADWQLIFDGMLGRLRVEARYILYSLHPLPSYSLTHAHAL
eukprot:1529949-Pleurochrysis_carterae.AAC.1